MDRCAEPLRRRVCAEASVQKLLRIRLCAKHWIAEHLMAAKDGGVMRADEGVVIDSEGTDRVLVAGRLSA